MLKAVIFDWGGVLIDNPFSGLIAYCSEALDVPPDRFAEVREAHYPAFLKGLGIALCRLHDRLSSG